MVVMKFTLLRSDEVMLNAIAMIQIDWPVSHIGQRKWKSWPNKTVFIWAGRRSWPAACRRSNPTWPRRPEQKSCRVMRTALMKKRMTLPMFRRGKAMSTVPICSGMT
jgi:hypothetical protein